VVIFKDKSDYGLWKPLVCFSTWLSGAKWHLAPSRGIWGVGVSKHAGRRRPRLEGALYKDTAPLRAEQTTGNTTSGSQPIFSSTKQSEYKVSLVVIFHLLGRMCSGPLPYFIFPWVIRRSSLGILRKITPSYRFPWKHCRHYSQGALRCNLVFILS